MIGGHTHKQKKAPESFNGCVHERCTALSSAMPSPVAIGSESGITFSLSKFDLLSFLSIAAIILAKLIYKRVISCLLYNGIKRCKE